ncbi:type II secretion system protein GspD [Aquincola tertiaricarbonis]|uniref:Type II secretion system protein GspD n=1 Tax=Aquincola tertiaricarbonis TaxID=391953 RepID=A0ABY4S4B9_AQUTE|nr:secretin N-terminal domain-containing protein [Aquincola tertiaricarbonis]URI06717.1 type II secretion system protein GspD [Aquincola tertiaricarbonis]
MLAACALALATAQAAAAAPSTMAPTARGAGTTTLNFPDIEVEAAARVIADLLNRPVLVDPRVKGKLTLYTEQPVSSAQAMSVFVTGLRGLNLAMIESNGLLKILPEADAKLQSSTVRVDTASVRAGDPVQTQVFKLVHENGANLVPALRPLIAANNTINYIAGTNALVITDYASNLQRLGQLISALDQPGATDVEVIRLQHVLATEVAPLVQRFVDDTGGASAQAAGGTAPAGLRTSGSGPGIVADGRINALLVRAPHPARLAAIRGLVARLDQPGSTGLAGSNVHVIYLQHTEATRLATVLRAAFPAGASGASGGSSSPSSPQGSGGGVGGGSTPGLSAAAGSSSSGNADNSGGANSKASTAATTGAAAPVTGGHIQADPASNSLIVTAPEPLFRQLRAVVDQLDTRRAQLYVESLVVEVDASKALDVGLQWKQIFNISATTTDLTLGTVAQALQSMSGTNILSTANLVTLDNEEAKIVVGQNVPFVTGSYTSTSSSTPFQTIERKDVGLTLRIRPQIGPNGAIRLSILQESSSVASTTTPGTTNAGPTTNKRAIESTVMVNDGKIIVLGGLIEDGYTTQADQWPVLGEIPVLGAFFRTLSRTRSKTNLMVFLRPVVMPDEEGSSRLSLDRYDYMRSRQQALPADASQVLPGREMPLAPDWTD